MLFKQRISESAEQITIFEWAAFCSGRRPELNLLFHVPNGGERSASEAGRFKAEGVKSGVPDLVLPVARSGYHGLYIELKASDGVVSDKQEEWIDMLKQQSYYAAVCYGADEAITTIENYLKGVF